jgi:ribosomal protein S18 acetylase RimI-like enzyme
VATSVCTIRFARPDDVPAIYLLKWQMALAEGVAQTLRASEADWRRAAFGPQPQFFAIVAETEGAVVGMATVVERYSPPWGGPLCVIDDVFVAPAHRGRGIGKALLARAAAEALRRGVPFVELMVRVENPARRLYERIGFERIRGAATYVLAGNALLTLADTFQTIGSAIAV